MREIFWQIYRELVVLFGGYTDYWMYPDFEKKHRVEMERLRKERGHEEG